MNDIALGIGTILLCSVGYFYSWKFQTRDNFFIAVLLLMVCGLILRIYTSMDFYLHDWDERYHALVAKNLIHHPLTPTLYDNPILPYDFKNWTANNIWVHKQPLPLWTMALSMWLFGINEIALRLPSIILTTIGIGLTFSIASFFFNKKVGYLTAFLFSINGLVIELTGGRVATDHIDIFFLFFVELAIYFSILFSQKQKTIYNIAAGVSIGAAILSKWLPALIVLPIWFLLITDSKNFKTKQIVFQFLLLFATCVVVFLPWQLYIFKAFPTEASWEASFNFKHITEVLEEQTGPFYYFFDKIRINYGELIYLPLIWFSWQAIKTKNKKRFAILIWFWIPFLFFSFAKTKMEAYILFTAPALFIMTADFWFMLFSYRTNHKFKWLFNVILFLLIVLPIRYMIERVKPFHNADRNPQWVTELKKLNEGKIKNGILFNYDRPIEAMPKFYTNLTVYQNIPDKSEIEKLISQGHTVLLNDNEHVPSDIKTIEGVRVISLTTSTLYMTKINKTLIKL
ncbi:MAG: glycosyltransferase family 39 protein [Bacteroidetes bacterium]|nr:glycosyltransferase family 39 protein [Bacteroidota bacterium]